MSSTQSDAADIAAIALQFHELSKEGISFKAGSPVTAETLDLVGDAVTKAYNMRAVLAALRNSDNPERTLREWSKAMWTLGFNTGAMYAEKRGT